METREKLASAEAQVGSGCCRAQERVVHDTRAGGAWNGAKHAKGQAKVLAEEQRCAWWMRG